MTFRFVWLPVAGVAVALVVLHWTKPSWVYASDWLFLVLNSVFLTVLPLVVAYLAAHAYRDSGLLAVLGIGAGMLALAGSGTLPPLFLQIRDQNANVVMHNSAVLLAALCLFVGSLPAAGAAPLQLPGSRVGHLVVAYTAVLACLAIVCTLVATGAVPTFFVPGKGTTTLRSFVLGAALVLFALAATFWWQTYVRTRVPFLRWYYLGLVLFVLGIVTILQVTIVGSAFSWVGRVAQYLAVAYLLVAVLSARRPKSAALVERGFAWSMLQSSLSYRPLVESVSEAIGVLDETGRVLYWNGAAERLFGYRASDAFGADLVELIVPTARREVRAEIAAALSASDPAGGRAGGHLDVTLVDGDGREFPAEAAFYRNLVGANRLTVCMIRDITARRQAEERLAVSEERFRTAFDGAPIGAAIEELNPSPGHFLSAGSSVGTAACSAPSSSARFGSPVSGFAQPVPVAGSR